MKARFCHTRTCLLLFYAFGVVVVGISLID